MSNAQVSPKEMDYVFADDIELYLPGVGKITVGDFRNVWGKMEPIDILNENNLEIRRLKMDWYGMNKFMNVLSDQKKLKVLDDSENPYMGTLYEIDLGDGDIRKYLKVACPTPLPKVQQDAVDPLDDIAIAELTYPLPSNLQLELSSEEWEFFKTNPHIHEIYFIEVSVESVKEAQQANGHTWLWGQLDLGPLDKHFKDKDSDWEWTPEFRS